MNEYDRRFNDVYQIEKSPVETVGSLKEGLVHANLLGVILLIPISRTAYPLGIALGWFVLLNSIVLAAHLGTSVMKRLFS